MRRLSRPVSPMSTKSTRAICAATLRGRFHHPCRSSNRKTAFSAPQDHLDLPRVENRCRQSSTRAPPSRFSNGALTGTRLLLNPIRLHLFRNALHREAPSTIVHDRLFASVRRCQVKFVPATSRARHRRVREEQLLPADLVVSDGLLSFGRDKPVDELLPGCRLYMRTLRGIHQHDAILIEQPLVAFDQDRQIALVLEIDPGTAIG